MRRIVIGVAGSVLAVACLALAVLLQLHGYLLPEVKAADARADQVARERDACFVGVRAGEQLWEGRGIVRAVYPRLLIVTHEEIPGLLPARTTGFRLADPAVPGRARAGDPIRFWLQGSGYDNNTLVKVEPW